MTKSFLLRVDPELLEAIREWAAEELRSLNAHIVFMLWQALDRRIRKDASDEN